LNDKEQNGFWRYLVKKAFFGCERQKTHFDSQVKWILGIFDSSQIF
jgi:hypothetical protein